MLYTCAKCSNHDKTGWTYYYTHRAMGIAPRCAICDPTQRCHWHNEAARRAQDEAALGEVDIEHH